MRPPSYWQRGRSIYSLILRQTLRLQITIIVLGLLLPPLAVLPLHLQQQIIDEAIPARDIDMALWFAALYLAATALRGGLKFFIGVLRGVIAAVVARVLRAALINAQRKRPQRSARRSLGTVTSVLTGEVQPLGQFAAEAINTPLIQGGTLIGVFGYMLATDARLALIGIVSLLAEAILTPIIQRKINQTTATRIATLRGAGADLIAVGTNPTHDAIYRAMIVDGLSRIRRAYRIVLRTSVLKALLKSMRNMINHVADIAVIAFGATLVIHGEIEIGVVVAFLSGLREVRGPWGELVSFYRRFADATVKYTLVRTAMNGGSDALAVAVSDQIPTTIPPSGRA